MNDQNDNVQVDYEDDYDGIGEARNKVPKGWAIYTWVTVAWMFYYVYAYTPLFSGWTQTAGLE